MASAAELSLIIKAQNDTTAVLKAIQRDLKDTEARANSFGASLKRINETAAGFLQAQVISRGLGAIKDLFGASVGAASDYNESLSKTQVVFGSLSVEIERFASSSAKNLGLSQQATLEAVSTFGNLFTAMRLSRPASVEMSKSLVQLAADLASFNNIPVEEALIKLRAGLVGEIEPLRTLGVNLTQATIEARAFQLGIAKQGETLNAAQKAQAAYSIILEQTKTAQGDFARTADGTANKNRILQASFADLRKELGQELEPTFNRVISTIIQKVQDPAFQQGVRNWVAAFRDFGGDVAEGFNRDIVPAFEWIIDNEGRITAAIVAIGLAFAWINPVAAGLGAITLLLARAGQNQGKESFFDRLRREQVDRNVFRGIGPNGENPFNIQPSTLGQGTFDPTKGIFNTLQAARDRAEAERQARNNRPDLPAFPDIVPPLKDNTEALKALREQLGTALQSFINLDNVSKAVSALFGRPTREQADLQLRQAEQNAFKARFGERAVHFGPGEGPGTAAKIDQQLKTLDAERDVLQKRITAANSLLITEQQLNTEAGNLRDLMASQSSLIKDKLNPSINDLYPELNTAYTGFSALNSVLSGPQSVVEGFRTFARELSNFKWPEFKDPNNNGQLVPFTAVPGFIPGFGGAR